MSKRKVGQEVHCPKCAAPMIVPTPERVEAEATVHQQQPVAAGGSASGPAFDDIIEAIGEPIPVRRRPAEPAPEPDGEVIAFSRRWLYAQAGIIVVVGLASYLLGTIFGSRSAPPAAELSAPVETNVVQFRLTFEGSDGKEAPDEGAIVVVWPAEKIPAAAERLPGGDFAPERAAPTESAMQLLKSWGGAFGRADAKGDLQLSVGKADKYRLVAISRHATRPTAALDRVDQALLDKLFVEPEKLVGLHPYLLKRTDLINGAKLSHRFASAK